MLNVVSLFSGCGGLDKGFEMTGKYKHVFANDIDDDAIRVFKANLGDIVQGDITSDEILKMIPQTDVNVVLAGFPCQPFSNAGNRKGVDDPRGKLYQSAIKVVGMCKPDVVLFENVRGLLSSKFNEEKKLIDVIVDDLHNIMTSDRAEDSGYEVTYELVNSSDYGVPQNRYRVLIIGVRRDLKKTFVFPKKNENKELLKLKYVLDIPENVPNQKDWPLSPQAINIVEHIPEGGSWKSVPDEYLPERMKKIKADMKRYHAPNFYRRFSREEINGTITASAQPENCGIIHPTLNRRYTIREIARIQSFPDDYVFFDESLKDAVGMYKVIGNSVPVKMASVFANAIFEQIFETDKEKEQKVAITPEKAYILGILIGGGSFNDNSVSVTFPFKKWGKIKENPDRAGIIAEDLINNLKPRFETAYNLNITYKVLKAHWKIEITGDLSLLTSDLKDLGIEQTTQLMKEFPVGKIIPHLKSDRVKRIFIAGLADTIGSVAASHRRFSDEVQIISFELSTFEFNNVMQFCQLLHSVGYYPDQVLWNHPSMHATLDKYYKGWKKGMKVRVTIDQYLTKESFGFSSKVESASQNLQLQENKHKTCPCSARDCKFGYVCKHYDIDSNRLPPAYRGYIFFHHKQICAAGGCPNAPYVNLDAEMKRIPELVSPFTIMTRGTYGYAQDIIDSDPLLSTLEYSKKNYTFSELYNLCNKNKLMFSKGSAGYPSARIIEGIHFLLCVSVGNVNGTRPIGNQKDCFSKTIASDSKHSFEISIPDKFAPLIIKDGEYAVIIGPIDPELNKKLIIADPQNKYLIKLKEPTAEDLNDRV